MSRYDEFLLADKRSWREHFLRFRVVSYGFCTRGALSAAFSSVVSTWRGMDRG